MYYIIIPYCTCYREVMITACHYLLLPAKSMGLYSNDTKLVCGCVVVRRYKRGCCAVVLANVSHYPNGVCGILVDINTYMLLSLYCYLI